MQVIDFGYKLPEVGDQNFWDSYNFDITRLSTHDHDGVNSTKLSGNSHSPTETILATGSWVAVGGGDPRYYQDISFPVAWSMSFPVPGVAQTLVQMFGATTGDRVFMEWGPNPTNDGIRVYTITVPLENIHVAFY